MIIFFKAKQDPVFNGSISSVGIIGALLIRFGFFDKSHKPRLFLKGS